MLFQIRATSGGGKTTCARYLMDCAKAEPWEVLDTARGHKVLANKGAWMGHDFYLIGPYDKEGTGGCDRLASVKEVTDLVHKYAKRDPDNIVVFEGLLIAHSWGALGEFLHAKYGHRYWNGFIDTTVEQCYKNVLKRRDKAGADNTDKERLAKIKKNVVADHYRVELAYKRVTARGGHLVDLPYQRSGPEAAEYITSWCFARAEKCGIDFKLG